MINMFLGIGGGCLGCLFIMPITGWIAKRKGFYVKGAPLIKAYYIVCSVGVIIGIIGVLWRLGIIF